MATMGKPKTKILSSRYNLKGHGFSRTLEFLHFNKPKGG
jgi:hypothetical protein